MLIQMVSCPQQQTKPHSLKMHIEAFCTNSTAGQEAEYGERKKGTRWRLRCGDRHHSLWARSDCSTLEARLRTQVTCTTHL